MSTHFTARSTINSGTNSVGVAGTPSRCRVAFMGTPDFVVPVLDGLAANPALNVVAAYVPPDRPRGRGRSLTPAPVKQRALELGIPVAQPATLRNSNAVAELAGFEADVIVVAAYGRILPPDVLGLPRFGCLNLHPSLLPRHRGPSPVVSTILAGDETTGVTLMLLDEGMDTGPIIAQRQRPVSWHDDAISLTATLFADGVDLLNESLPGWLAGAIQASPQDDALATYTAKIERADGAVDWTLSAITLARRLRAYTPWPGLHTRWNGIEVKILAAEAIDGDGVDAGVVVDTGSSSIAIGTGDGLLSVGRLQVEGKRAAGTAEFLRGYPQFIGARLGDAAV